ncbi:MAG: ArdC family protein [Dysosmobacter welbionis]
MERVRALTDQLEAGITGLFQSGQYAAYLQSLSKLHHYSYGNIFLIKLQCPHASMVAGYGDWKRKFGRHVKAGETGITILAPCPYWARDEVEETGPDGQTIKEQKWVKKLVSPRLRCLMSARQRDGNSQPGCGVLDRHRRGL